jgi:hypothetical protein
MSLRQREKLISNYIRARDNYRRAVTEARKDYEELVERGLMRADDGKSKQ